MEAVPLHRAPSLRFADAAHRLSEAARLAGLAAPTFRSPPADERLDRSVRRRRDGSAIVAVRVRGRPFEAVLADMIEGTVVANKMVGPRAAQVRNIMWSAALESVQQAA